MTTTPQRDAIHWFEIPVADIDRAQRFYETLFARSMRREQMGPQTLAVFAYDNGTGIGGALLASATAPKPAADGTLVYLNAKPSLDAVLARARELGATVLQDKLELPRDIGFIAQILDCEGNRIGLHSPTA